MGTVDVEHRDVAGDRVVGAIAELTHQNLREDFRRFDTRSCRILLIEAGPRILPSFTADLSDYAYRALQKLGVEVQVGLPVSDCNASGVMVAGRPVAALVPLDDYVATGRQQSVLPLAGSGRGLWGRDSTRTLRKLRDEWTR